MEKLSIAICEDSPDDRKRMEAALASSNVSCSCEWFENGESFLEGFSRGAYDLVFLDVYMGALSGVEVARRIREIDPDVTLAFVTTSEDFAMDGYRSKVAHYLLKPYADSDVREVVESAAGLKGSLREASLNLGGGNKPVPYSRIVFVEQKNHTSMVHLANGDEARRTGRLDDIESALPCPPFYRCHKSFLVNLDHVKRVDRDLNVFEMDTGQLAYIRRASVRDAQRAFEARLIERTKAL